MPIDIGKIGEVGGPTQPQIDALAEGLVQALDVGGQVNAASYATLDEAKALTIPAARIVLSVGGRAVEGDSPITNYKRVSSEPAHPGKFQDASGAWFEFFGHEVSVEMFDPETNYDKALYSAIVVSNALGIRFTHKQGAVYISQNGVNVSGMDVVGTFNGCKILRASNGAGGSILHAVDPFLTGMLAITAIATETIYLGWPARTLNLPSNYINNETVTIAQQVYTFKTTLTGAAFEVLIGASASATLDNLVRAVNDAPVAGSRTLTATGAFSEGETITVGTRTYTLSATITTADRVKLSTDAATTIYNLVAAINGSGIVGVNYGPGTAPHALVNARSGTTGATLIVTALVPGAVSIASTETCVNASFNGSILGSSADSGEGTAYGLGTTANTRVAALKLDSSNVTVTSRTRGLTTTEYTTSTSRGSWVIDTGSTSVSRIDVDSGTMTTLLAAGLKVNSVLKLCSDDLIPWGTQAVDNERLGEFVEVSRISGNSIYTYRPLRVTLTTNPRIQLCGTHKLDIDRFWGEDQGSNLLFQNSLIRITGYTRPYLFRPTCFFGMTDFLTFRSCYRPQTLEAHITDLRTSTSAFYNAYAYGIVERGVTDGYHENARGSRLRHLYTTGAGSVNTIPGTDPLQYGGVIGTKIIGGFATECEHQAFDTHADAAYVQFIDCYSGENHRGHLASVQNFQLRGWRNSIINCTSVGMAAINMNIYGTGGEFVIKNHRHTRPAGLGTNLPVVDMSGQSYTGPGNPWVWLDIDIVADDQNGGLIASDGVDIRTDLTTIDMQATTASNCNVYSTNADVEYGTLRVDLRRGTVGGVRIFKTASASIMNVRGRHLDVQTNPSNSWQLGDFSSTSSVFQLGRVTCNSPPSLSDGGFSNRVAQVTATGTLTATANFAEGETVTIGNRVYTFSATLDAAYKIKIGVDTTASLLNLIKAIMSTGIPGTDYGTATAGTLGNEEVFAVAGAGTTIDLTARAIGPLGNAIVTTETCANASFGATTLTAGAGSVGLADVIPSMNMGATPRIVTLSYTATGTKNLTWDDRGEEEIILSVRNNASGAIDIGSIRPPDTNRQRLTLMLSPESTQPMRVPTTVSRAIVSRPFALYPLQIATFIAYRGQWLMTGTTASRDGVDLRGDAAVTLTLFSQVTQYWNVPITANRAVTMPTGAVAGDRFKFIRGIECTGDNFAIQIPASTGTFGLYGPGDSAELIYTGAQWVLFEYVRNGRQTRGNASYVLTTSSASIQIFTNALTNLRTIQLPANGDRFLILRESTCTGAFNLDVVLPDAVTVLKSLTTAGQSVEVYWDVHSAVWRILRSATQ